MHVRFTTVSVRPLYIKETVNVVSIDTMHVRLTTVSVTPLYIKETVNVISIDTIHVRFTTVSVRPFYELLSFHSLSLLPDKKPYLEIINLKIEKQGYPANLC